MKYKAVIFDLYGTLVENYRSSESNKILKKAAGVLSAPPDKVISFWYKAYRDRQIGVLKTYEDCFARICRELGIRPSWQQLDSAAAFRLALTRREIMSYRKGALEMLKYLKTNGYKTGLISNCSFVTIKIWLDTLLAPLIDVPVFSCLEGTMKPDPRLFQTALERLSVLPGECLYIADGMSQELTTASKLGMHAVLINARHDTEYEFDREKWSGPAISSLKEVITILER